MAEQTHIKNKTEHEKYFERLQTEDAYKLLKEVYDEVSLDDFPDLRETIYTFLHTGILEGQYRDR